MAAAAANLNAQIAPDGLRYERNGQGGITITKYTGTAAALVIPAAIDRLPVTAIGWRAFYRCSSLASVTIPGNVTAIELEAFRECNNLTSVTIGAGVTAIGDAAFWGCSGLTSVTIPGSVTAIREAAFYRCSSLTGITVDKNNAAYTSIGGVVFSKDQKTLIAYPGGKKGAYTIPNSVTSIGGWAFSGCSSLASVAIPTSVTSIGDAAFHGCSSLASVAIPTSVTSIREAAFLGCSSLASVAIPASVTAIGWRALSGCGSLASVAIPGSVTYIGEAAFDECSSLTSVTFEGGSRISSGNFANNNEYSAFDGDLPAKYFAQAGGAGTYTRPPGGTTWIKEDVEAARLAEERKAAAARTDAAKAEAARLAAAKTDAERAEAAARAALAELAAEAERIEAARKREAAREAAEPPFTGDGGAGKSIAVLLPKYKEADADLPTMVQDTVITDFKKYSAFTVLDRETLDRLLKETIDPAYTDNLDIVRLGHVIHTDYIMTGNIIKTRTGYVMTLKVANTIDGTINASTSSAYTLDALENLTGIRKAAAELLTQLGVALTHKAKQELAGGF
jgi:TolB-like protein